jgi:hypothetical protein
MRRILSPTLAFLACAALGHAQSAVTIRVGVMLDGKGGIRRNVTITIEGSKILRVDPAG